MDGADVAVHIVAKVDHVSIVALDRFGHFRLDGGMREVMDHLGAVHEVGHADQGVMFDGGTAKRKAGAESGNGGDVHTHGELHAVIGLAVDFDLELTVQPDDRLILQGFGQPQLQLVFFPLDHQVGGVFFDSPDQGETRGRGTDIDPTCGGVVNVDVARRSRRDQQGLNGEGSFLCHNYIIVRLTHTTLL